MKSVSFDQEEYVGNLRFPLLIEYTDVGERVEVEEPEDIDNARPFRVLQTNVGGLGLDNDTP